ncbi:MAG: kinase/pyrophosphorylase [Deltaproteobacteria bacterium]|nr:kinase/pyrophosphorylase [Deltaproteobacteria bacterium]
MPIEKSQKTIFAVSDATGELALSASVAAIRQFSQPNVTIARRSKVATPENIARVVMEAHESGGLIIFTLVSPSLRELLKNQSDQAGVVAIDLMGPVLDKLSEYLQTTPSDQPGLKYQLTNEYFRRNEAVEFAVKHDDGLGLDTLGQSDIILVGISRTSKTPLSIYLSYRGYKVANIPIVNNVPPPPELFAVDRGKVVGLTASPEKLVAFRELRLSKMGRPMSENYATVDHIRSELIYAQKIFAQLGNCPIIDVTAKAIEEVASEIQNVLGK